MGIPFRFYLYQVIYWETPPPYPALKPELASLAWIRETSRTFVSSGISLEPAEAARIRFSFARRANGSDDVVEFLGPALLASVTDVIMT